MQKLFVPEQHTLSNGIPVIFQNLEGAVGATYWWVKTGSADEDPREAGFAHYLEHMLFKDTDAKESGTSSTGQTARAIESLGGDINAYTSFDQTVYHVTCAAHHWEKVISHFGPMAKPQKFLKSDFLREREVILEELKKNEDSPSRQLFQELFSQTYKKHPYGKPVIGYVRTLKAATAPMLESFYRRQYVSEKMGLVLVGPLGDDRRKKDILNLLEKYFGEKVIPTRKLSPHTRPAEVPLQGPVKTKKRVFDVQTPSLSISFRVPDLKHSDMAALDLLAGVLGMGEVCRLYQKLFYQKTLVTDVSAGAYVPNDPGMLYFQAEMDSPGKMVEVAKTLFEELARIKTEGPTREELDRVLVNAESERLYATQSADSVAGRIGFMAFVLGDLNYDERYLQELRAVTPETLREVASRYLVVNRMSSVALVPKKDKTPIDLTEIDRLAAQILPSVETPKVSRAAKAHVEKIEQFVLPNGLRVNYFHRPSSHAFSIHGAVFGGTRLELSAPIESPEKDWGASHLISQTWNKGTQRRTSQEIAKLTEGKAASIEGFSGRNTIGLQGMALSRDWKAISDLYTEVLLSASFPDSEVEHSRRVSEDSLRGIQDHSSQLCSKYFFETLFERHPYGKLTLGSEESIKGMTSAKLKQFHRRWIRPETLVLTVSGSVERKDLDIWLKDVSNHPFFKAATQSPKPERIPQEFPLVAPRWIEKNLGREQVHIITGGLGTTMRSPDRYPLKIMQNILGGQSGRLFVELREKKSLAYTVAPVGFDGIEQGYQGIYIGCSPNKKKEAQDGIRMVLEKLAEKGPTVNEVNRAKEYLLGRRAMDLQSDHSLAGYIGLETLYGSKEFFEDVYLKSIQKVTAKQVQDVCRRYLIDPSLVTSVVG